MEYITELENCGAKDVFWCSPESDEGLLISASQICNRCGSFSCSTVHTTYPCLEPSSITMALVSYVCVHQQKHQQYACKLWVEGFLYLWDAASVQSILLKNGSYKLQSTRCHSLTPSNSLTTAIHSTILLLLLLLSLPKTTIKMMK